MSVSKNTHKTTSLCDECACGDLACMTSYIALEGVTLGESWMEDIEGTLELLSHAVSLMLVTVSETGLHKAPPTSV